jgi:hypothetical protein
MNTINLLLISASLAAVAFTVSSISTTTVIVTDPERFDANAQSVNSVIDTTGSNVVWGFSVYSLATGVVALRAYLTVKQNLNQISNMEYDERMEYDIRDQDADLASFMDMQRNDRLNAEALEHMGVFENQF